MKKERQYAIGVDFGSLSARGVLADIRSGRIAVEASMEYPHGILYTPPGNVQRHGEWILQNPQDYLETLYRIIPELMAQSGVAVEQIVGIGIDFTASTVIPLRNFRPMSEEPAWTSRPHAWTKLWKYHGAYSQARRLTELCRKQNRPYLEWYGGSISQECLMSKVLQVFEEDREVFEAADCFMEAADYMTSLLTGTPVFSASLALAKALWSKEDGYPDKKFFTALDDTLGTLPEKLMGHFPNHTVGFPGKRVGSLCRKMAEKLGLLEGIAVSAPQMDAYAAMPGLGITEPGTMLLMVGTSTADILLSEKHMSIEGITACLPDTCYPGLWTYASGQASVGDCFQWCVDTCVPESYAQTAREREISLHAYLTDLAFRLKPGQTGLLALDWFNGNKSCLANSRLSGMFLGLTIQTKPEHIYRSLLEATAFGARAILESYEKKDILVEKLVVCGGIALKNPLMMQMYADVLNKPLLVSTCTQVAALGAAICGAAAAGEETMAETARRMGARDFLCYEPKPEAVRIYELLYQEYTKLSDYFGRGENRVMEFLGTLRNK